VYLHDKYGSPIDHEAWSDLCKVIDWIAGHWDQADEGVWEVRGGRQNFTYSRLMSWVAVERAIRIAMRRGLPADLTRWQSTRDSIYHQVMRKGLAPGAPGLRPALRHRRP
jgi:GH15 family glucan-1,4-alpha-glucosidase